MSTKYPSAATSTAMRAARGPFTSVGLELEAGSLQLRPHRGGVADDGDDLLAHAGLHDLSYHLSRAGGQARGIFIPDVVGPALHRGLDDVRRDAAAAAEALRELTREIPAFDDEELLVEPARGAHLGDDVEEPRHGAAHLLVLDRSAHHHVR